MPATWVAGNWTRDEDACLSGSYAPLVATLREFQVGTLFLELCTPRAGEMAILRGLRADQRVGVGAVDPKHARIETPEKIVARAREAIGLFGGERVLLVPDCGFATFADNPVSPARIAERKLAAMAEAARRLRT